MNICQMKLNWEGEVGGTNDQSRISPRLLAFENNIIVLSQCCVCQFLTRENIPTMPLPPSLALVIDRKAKKI